MRIWRIEMHINGTVYQVYNEVYLTSDFGESLNTCILIKVNVNQGLKACLIMCRIFPILLISFHREIESLGWYSKWFLTLDKHQSSLELLKNTNVQLCPDLLKKKVGFSLTQPHSGCCWSSRVHALCWLSHLKGHSLTCVWKSWLPVQTELCTSSLVNPFSVSPLQPTHPAPCELKVEVAAPILWTLVISKHFYRQLSFAL